MLNSTLQNTKSSSKRGSLHCFWLVPNAQPIVTGGEPPFPLTGLWLVVKWLVPVIKAAHIPCHASFYRDQRSEQHLKKMARAKSKSGFAPCNFKQQIAALLASFINDKETPPKLQLKKHPPKKHPPKKHRQPPLQQLFKDRKIQINRGELLVTFRVPLTPARVYYMNQVIER